MQVKRATCKVDDLPTMTHGCRCKKSYRFKVRYGELENPKVASLEPCQLGIGPNIRSVLREDTVEVGGEGVEGVARNGLSTWRRPINLRVWSSWLLGNTKKCVIQYETCTIAVATVWPSHREFCRARLPN